MNAISAAIFAGVRRLRQMRIIPWSQRRKQGGRLKHWHILDTLIVHLIGAIQTIPPRSLLRVVTITVSDDANLLKPDLLKPDLTSAARKIRVPLCSEFTANRYRAVRA